MINFRNGGHLVQSTGELPNLSGAKRLYLDLETTSGDPKKTSFNPWKDCATLGIAATVDDAPGAWYVPVRHHDGRWNLPKDAALAWLRSCVQTCHTWVNHNVKYDAHVAANDGVEFNCELACTLAGAKIIDSDRTTRGGYSLDALSDAWLGIDIKPYEHRLQPFLDGSKDYGDIPADILGEYACQDAITARALLAYIESKMPEQCGMIWGIEQRVTAVLYDMERAGMRVDSTELLTHEYHILGRLLHIEEKIHNLVGVSVRPHVNDDCYDLLCNRYGLPILVWTEPDRADSEAGPSFDKEALQSYLRHPTVVASATLTEVITLMLQYRKLNTLLTFFVRPFLDLHVDGILHPQYNQIIRTGRMSCRGPNAQQLDRGPEGAKTMVHPHPGYAFLSVDYSQIEFRLIVHYIRDPHATQAYLDDPDTDFHQWVADICGIPRRPAKNVNFAIGYGGGKNRVLSMLASNMDLVGSLMSVVDAAIGRGELKEVQRLEMFTVLCRRRAEQVYDGYHRMLPNLKRVTRRAGLRCKSRGYTFTAYGRHRHLPQRASWRAFNSITQGTAADVMKERLVASSPRYNPEVRALGITQQACVHDEVLFHGPTEVMRDPRTWSALAALLEATSVEFRVPMRVIMGVSDKSWYDAGTDAAAVEVPRPAVA